MRILQEKDIEKYFVRRVRDAGGKAYKFVSPGNNGVPDRMVCLPGGRVVFVELKAPGKVPRPMQIHQIGILREFGFRVEIVDSKESADEFILSLQEGDTA